MLSIDFGKKTLENSTEHYLGLKDNILNKRLNKHCNENELKSFIEEQLEIILCGGINDLLMLHKKIKEIPSYDGFKPILKNIFNYDWFRGRKRLYNGYSLANNLQIDCCPYCNRNYTSSHSVSVKEGKMKYVFPEFDHFLPQKEYPLLALSFYNLIPSCNICNTLQIQR